MTAAEPSSSQTSAGSILRQLRDRKNLSVQEVAAHMRLDPKIIEALEADNYSVFPADTYIRGYMRNYAKLLGINGDEIISLYQSDALAPPEIIPDVKHPTQVSSSDKPVKAFTYLITFILVLLLFIWWRQSNFSFIDSISETVVPGPVATTPARETMRMPPDVPAAILDTLPANSTITDVAVEQHPPAAATPAVAATDGTITTAAAEGAEVTITGGSAVTTTETDDDNGNITAITPASVPASETPAIAVAESDGEIRAVPGPDSIILKLNADCWIDIRDQFDREVYQDLARTGEEIRLTGQAPFHVELGNAQGVILEFNGKPYDPAPVTTRGIARFTLGN